MYPQFPLQMTCSHRYEPFQLTFARHALQILPRSENSAYEATHQGLVLRGETESALAQPLAALKDYFGNQIRVGTTAVRYHRAATLEEPHMRVRVQCPRECFAAVKFDLVRREGEILHAQITGQSGAIDATAPLETLLGYTASLAELTAGRAKADMAFSHYAPVRSPPPGGNAA